MTNFLVLYLHDERGMATARAAAVLALVQALAVVLRIVLGRVSDLRGDRVGPLRILGAVTAVATVLLALALSGPIGVAVVALVAAGTVAMAWNGLSFTVAAELAGAARSGAATGFQQTVLSATGALVPPLFAAGVEATSWSIAFGVAALAPLVGALTLRALRGAV